ncbi:unnamed protein product [Brachionus calyciflorus]|uniref:EGF-like domain-containing protein n=1 Tax=Brachionus calyciflorus TaxID=104777 RepID=A0A814F986_9BILA|nr:unnamed protein product [Brachionus calyciflorus]
MFYLLIFLSLYSNNFILQVNASLYITGSDDNFINIWNDSSIFLSKNISGNVTCLGIDLSRNIIIAGTHNGKIYGWDVQSNLLTFDNGNETKKVNSILIINSTHFLAGYNGFIIYWSLPEISQIKKINDSRFGTIGDMKNLTSDNLVLIVNVQAKMIVFSLENDSIVQINDIVEQGYSFDVINKSFIYSPCKIDVANDICLFILTGNFSLIQIDLVLLDKQYTGLKIILSIDIVDDRIITGHKNGSISHFRKDNLNLIETFEGNILGLPINVVKKLDSNLSIHNLFSMTSTSFRNPNEILDILKSEIDLNNSISNYGFLNPNEIFRNFMTNEVLDILTSEIDVNNCISNCSGNGYCKLVDNKKLICECYTNFAGPACEINTLPCHLNKCRNNGSCINNFIDKTYTCQCYSDNNNRSLYFGNFCEFKIDLCENETCSNNGICQDTGNESKCKCFSKFSGVKCETASHEIKVIKSLMKTASFIAIIVLAMTFGTLIFFDLINFFNSEKTNKKNRSPPKKIHKIYKN